MIALDKECTSLADMDIDSMTDDELREWHQKICSKHPYWSHAFDIFDHKIADGNESTSIETPNDRVARLFTREHLLKMGRTISEDTSFATTLNLLDLSNCNLNDEDIEAIFGCGRTYSFPLRVLNLRTNGLGANSIASMIPFFKSMTNMKILILDGINLGAEGTRLLSEVLRHVCIEQLSIEHTRICSESIENLLSATHTNHLVDLHLSNNVIRTQGIRAISRFLRRDDLALKKLTMQCNEGRHAKMVCDSISNNSKLEKLLFFDADDEQVIYPESISGLVNLICNRSSFDALCQSSHHLNYIGDMIHKNVRDMLNKHEILRDSLDINKRANGGTPLGKIMKSKLRSFYFNHMYYNNGFRKHSFDVQPFQNMDVVLMPYALELVTRIEGTDNGREHYDLCFGYLGDIYHMIRNCHMPVLFSYPSPKSKMQQLEARIAALEAENLRWKQEFEVLTVENRELRDAKPLPNKRTKY